MSQAENEEGEGAAEAPSRRPQDVAWEVLVAPLIDMGMRKQRRHSADEHQRMLRRVAAKVSYLRVDQLLALGEVVARHAGGRERNLWPDEVSICNWAAAIEVPPESDSRLVRTYLASRAGQSALDEGIEVAVALRRHLKRQGRPPNAFDWAEIRAKAAEWRHARDDIRRRTEAGGARAEDDAWLTAFEGHARVVRALVEGDVHDAA